MSWNLKQICMTLDVMLEKHRMPYTFINLINTLSHVLLMSLPSHSLIIIITCNVLISIEVFIFKESFGLKRGRWSLCYHSPTKGDQGHQLLRIPHHIYSTSSLLSSTCVCWFSDCTQLASGNKMLHLKMS